MKGKDYRLDIDKGKGASTKLTRRAALKRIALSTGTISLLGTIPSWGSIRFWAGLKDMDQPEQQQFAAYYSVYSSRYDREYFKYASFKDEYKSSYYSLAPAPSKEGGPSPGGTCFTDSLRKEEE